MYRRYGFFYSCRYLPVPVGTSTRVDTKFSSKFSTAVHCSWYGTAIPLYRGTSLRYYGGYTLCIGSCIEAPLITREVLPETYFLFDIMAADSRARLFFTVSSIMLMLNLVNF